MSMSVERGIRDHALKAVQLACQVAKQVQQSLVSEETITKKDNSPVTVGDYAVQALIIHQLSTAFPEYPFVAEEDSKTLSENPEVKKSVLKFVQQHFPEITEEGLIKTISKGGGVKSAADSKRWWTLDPIDGTSGYHGNQK